MLRRIFIIVGTAIASYISIAVGVLQEHPFWMYLGIVVGAILGIGIVVWLMKLTARFIGWAMSSALYTTLALTIVGLLIWNDVIPAFAGYVTAILLSAFLVLSIVRNISRWAQSSIIGGEIFSFISNYKIRSYILGNNVIDKETAYTYNEDYHNIITILRGLKYTKIESQDAARYAVTNTYVNQSIEDKVRIALNYLASKQDVVYQN